MCYVFILGGKKFYFCKAHEDTYIEVNIEMCLYTQLSKWWSVLGEARSKNSQEHWGKG